MGCYVEFYSPHLFYPTNSIFIKMVKDINAPKRPLTGYMRYINTIRAEVEAETGLNGIKVTPFLAQRWNELSEEEKEQYNKTFRKEMKKHKSAVAKYRKTGAYKAFLEKKKAKKFGKKPKDKNAPKRPSTAFFIFANEVREEIRYENPEASIGEIGKILGQQWHALNEEEKEIYRAQNEKAKQKYEKVLAKYKKSKNFAAHQEKLAAWKNAKKEALKAAKKEAKVNNKKKVVKRKK